MLFSRFSIRKSAKFASITDPRKHMVFVSTVHMRKIFWYLSVCEWRRAPLCVYKLSDSFLNYFLYFLPSLSCALRPFVSRLDSAWSVRRLYPNPVPISLVYEAGGEIWLSKKIRCFWLARLWANDLSVVFCARAMACAIHSLQSLQFCSNIFPEELVFRLNITCKTVFISPLIKTF